MASHGRIPGLVTQDRPRAVKEPCRGHRRPVHPHAHGVDAGVLTRALHCPEKACAVITLPPSLPAQAFALPGHTAAGRVSLAGQRTDRPGNDVPGSEPSSAQARTGYGCPIPRDEPGPLSEPCAGAPIAKRDRLPSLYIYALQPCAETSCHAADRVFRTAMALAPLSDVNAGRVCHLDGEADRRSRRKGRAAGTQARTIQLPRAPSAWIRAGDRHQPWIIGVPRTRQTAKPGTLRRNRPPLRSNKRLPGNVRLPTWHHAKRRGMSGRTRSDPPFGAAA